MALLLGQPSVRRLDKPCLHCVILSAVIPCSCTHVPAILFCGQPQALYVQINYVSGTECLELRMYTACADSVA